MLLDPGAAGVPHHGIGIKPYSPSDRALATVRVNYPQMTARSRPVRPVARRSRPEQRHAALREPAVLESRLRHAAQPRRDGRQSGRPGAAARRNAGLHRAARPSDSKNTARAKARRRPIPMPTRARSATWANDQTSRQTHRTGRPAEAPCRDEHIAPAPRVSIQAFCETVETAAAIQAAGEDRRMAKAHLKIQMGGITAAIEAYRGSPTPNVIMLETESRNDSILNGLDALAEVLRRRHARHRDRPPQRRRRSIASWCGAASATT